MELNLFKVGIVENASPIMAEALIFDEPPVYNPIDPIDLTPLNINLNPAPIDQMNVMAPVILDIPTTTNTNTPDYVASAGNFLDAKGNLLTAHWQWYNVKTGEVYAQAYATGFNVWGDTDLDNVALYVELHGYHSVRIKAAELQPNNDIVLKKIPYLVYLAAVVALIAMARKKHKQVGAVTLNDIMPFVYIGGGVLAFSFIKQILEALGIWKGKDTKALDDAASDPHSFWSPNYWKTIKPADKSWSYAIDITTAEEWLNDLRDAMSIFNDDESAAYAVFKRARTKANVSFMADIFARDYGEDLLSWLRGGIYPFDRLSDGEVYAINNYVNTLPNY